MASSLLYATKRNRSREKSTLPNNRTKVAVSRVNAPQKQELIALLKEKYGAEDEFYRLGRTALIRVVATFDFLSHNLPPKKAAI